MSEPVCGDQTLELTCSEDSVVVATIYGGYHTDSSVTNCSLVPGDCQAPIIDIDNGNECLWTDSVCRIKLTIFAYLDKPCNVRLKPIHYITAVDFTCVPSKSTTYLHNSARVHWPIGQTQESSTLSCLHPVLFYPSLFQFFFYCPPRSWVVLGSVSYRRSPECCC